MAQVEDILNRLCSSGKLERDKGAVELQRFVADDSDKASIRELEKSVLRLLQDDTFPWESRHGGLMAAKVLVFSEQLPDKNKHCSEEFPVKLRECAVNLLEDSESRVRLAAGTCKSECHDVYCLFFFNWFVIFNMSESSRVWEFSAYYLVNAINVVASSTEPQAGFPLVLRIP